MRGQRKLVRVSLKFFTKCTDLDKNLVQRLHKMSTNKPFPHQKLVVEKQYFEGQSLNHRLSFGTKSPISPPSERNSNIKVMFFYIHALCSTQPCSSF